MKRIAVGILALLYLAVSSGVVLEVHYCMGKMAGVELYGGHQEQCGKCGMKERKGGCCSDQLKVYKLEDVHKQVNSLWVAQNLSCPLPTTYPLMDWQLPADPAFGKTILRPPPDIGTPPLFIANRVFRI
jgi:hypothetical protein